MSAMSHGERRRGNGRRWLAAVLMLVVLAGCASCSNQQASINRRPQISGSATASAVNGVQQVTIYVNDTYRFSPDTITVHSGQVRVTLVHQGTGAPHDLEVVGFPGDFVPLVNPGGTSSATFTAPAPGTYKFICTIHQAQGQTGTLIVTAGS
jgi:plastocyanin